jgi:hypothetical protein
MSAGLGATPLVIAIQHVSVQFIAIHPAGSCYRCKLDACVVHHYAQAHIIGSRRLSDARHRLVTYQTDSNQEDGPGVS